MIPWVYFRSLHNYLAANPKPDPHILWDNFGIAQSATFLIGTGRFGINPVLHDLYNPAKKTPAVDFFQHKQKPVVLGLADNDPRLHPVLPRDRAGDAHRHTWASNYQLFIGIKGHEGKTQEEFVAQSVLELGLALAKHKIPFCMPQNPHAAAGRYWRILYYDPDLKSYNGIATDFTRYPDVTGLPVHEVLSIDSCFDVKE